MVHKHHNREASRGDQQEHERPVYFYSHRPVISSNSPTTALNSNLLYSYSNRVNWMYIKLYPKPSVSLFNLILDSEQWFSILILRQNLLEAVETQIAGPTPIVSGSVGHRIFISNKFSADADAAGPRTTGSRLLRHDLHFIKGTHLKYNSTVFNKWYTTIPQIQSQNISVPKRSFYAHL